MKKLIAIALLLVSCAKPEAPYNLIIQKSGVKSLLIGISALNDQTVWASGTEATILRTTDGGENWQSFIYEEVDTLQFRDIQAIDENTAIVLSIGLGNSSQILRFNKESGWQLLHQVEDDSGFLDAIEFWDSENGLAYGDAIDSIPYILKTEDGGDNWYRITENLPKAGKGEGGFASSGTNIETGSGGFAWIGTGAGGNARILFTPDYGKNWKEFKTPMVKEEAAGITSVRFVGDVGFITGGDLTNPEYQQNITFYSDTRGKLWIDGGKPKTQGAFYGSAFQKVGDRYVTIITGPKGADISLDMGQNWEKISPQNMWTCELLPSGNGWLMGKGGKILKIEVEE